MLTDLLLGAGSILASSDGYSKLFNENLLDAAVTPGAGSSIFEGMSRLDATVRERVVLYSVAR